MAFSNYRTTSRPAAWLPIAMLSTLCGVVSCSGDSGDPAVNPGPNGTESPAAGGGAGNGDVAGMGGAGSPGAPPEGGPAVPPPPAPEGFTAREPLAGRLTKDQLSNSIGDVLGATADAQALGLIPEDIIGETGFVTEVDAQAFSPAHVKGYSSLARATAKAVDIAALAQEIAGCAEASAACGEKLVAELGLRLFRRPLLAEEQTRFAQLFSEVAAVEGATFEHAGKALLRALLQSPQFLYKLEHETLGTPEMSRSTTGYELASRLSYFLWQSAPDTDLLAFAASVEAGGGNIDSAALSAEVARMMADGTKLARARQTFWADYSHASSAAFQDATPELGLGLGASITASLKRLSGDGAPEVPLSELFTTTDMMLTPDVAELIGLQGAGAGPQLYDTAALPERVGLLSHPGFLAGIGSTSFVGRGVILSQRVLCRTIIPPPVAAIEDEINDTAEETKDLTPKGASEFRLGLGGACQTCHKTFEPVAYAFERFGVLGDYREKDDQGRDLFTAGYLQGATGDNLGDYSGVAELMALLAASEETGRCLVENMLEFGSGRIPESADDAAIDAAHATYLTEGGTFSGLVRSIALSPQLSSLKVLSPQ